MSKLVPLGDNIIIEPTVPETQTTSGFFVPDKSNFKPEMGVIIAVGPGRKNDDGVIVSMDLNIGDKVIFERYAPGEFDMEGKKILFLKESNIIAKII